MMTESIVSKVWSFCIARVENGAARIEFRHAILRLDLGKPNPQNASNASVPAETFMPRTVLWTRNDGRHETSPVVCRRDFITNVGLFGGQMVDDLKISARLGNIPHVDPQLRAAQSLRVRLTRSLGRGFNPWRHAFA